MTLPVTLLSFGRSSSSCRPKDSFSHLLTSLRLLHLGTSPEGVDAPPCTTNAPGQSESFPPGIDQPFPIDSGALYKDLADLVRHLKPLLTVSCEWLEQGVLEFVGKHPVAAGGVADVWVGRMGSRKVAIKVYRCCSLSNNWPRYVVSGAYLWRVIYSSRIFGRSSTRKRWHAVASRT